MKTNKYIYKMLTEKLEGMLLAGAYPEVRFKIVNERGYTVKSCDMINYSIVNSKLSTVVNNALKNAGYKDGLFSTRLSNKEFLALAQEIIKQTTVEMMEALPSRMRTFAD